MRNWKQRLMAIFMTLAFCILLVQPVTVRAESIRIQCGDNVYATLNGGLLTISGTGDMWNANTHSHYFRGIAGSVYQVNVEDGVTSIGDNAFFYFSNGVGVSFEKIQKVSIGKTVRSIGEMAFAYTTGLFNIDIPGNVQTIEKHAFWCSRLKTCTLHPGLKTIGEEAFSYTGLTGISIPDDISTIGEGAFAYSSVSGVSIPKNIGMIMTRAFGNVSATIYSTDVTIVAGAFGSGSTLTVERGSTAEEYAKDFGVKLKYIQHPSKVSFNANGGSVSKKSKQVLSEAAYGALPKATRKGYEFVGWYTKKQGGSLVKSDTLVTSKNDSVLYAHWKKVSVKQASKPTLKNIKTRKVTVKIKKVSGASGYQIRYSLKSNMKSSKTATTTSLTKTLTNLKKGKTYYVQVRAYKKDSKGNRVYGSWSNKQKVKIKK